MNDNRKVRILSNTKTTNPIAVLEAAKDYNLDMAIVIGWDKDGSFVMSGSDTSHREICHLFKKFDAWINEQLI